ncbi:uncharacterized protein LOC112495389, partial [Cephus cinctus]|uniref:Uncharacterized protein LOC112495389 n=1 Tax=Cephus cinctus TaxID=211228 RepID=A0AAJ7RUU9_CEPCN
MVATGHLEEVKEQVEIPIQLHNREQLVTARLFTPLALPCVLGIDFLEKFNIRIDFARRNWCFASDPTVEFRFIRPDDSESPATCCGISELDSEQTQRLKRFLEEEVPSTSVTLGITNLAE